MHLVPVDEIMCLDEKLSFEILILVVKLPKNQFFPKIEIFISGQTQF